MKPDTQIVNLSRRTFLKGSALAAGGLILGFRLPLVDKLEAREGKPPSRYIDSWLQITPAGEVAAVIPVSEMGQGSQTALAMILADEIGADYQRLKIISALNNAVYSNPMLGMQITGGSTAVRAWWNPLREIGATIRSMLIKAAASQWQVNEAQCQVRNSKIFLKNSDKQIDFSAIVEAASELNVPKKFVLRDASEYQYIGKPMPRVDTLPKITGQPLFGIDVELPDMLIAAVSQSPVFGGSVKAMDKEAALKVPGVKAVMPIDNGVAVVASSYWQALTGLRALKPSFNGGNSVGLATAIIEKELQSGLDEQGKLVAGEESTANVKGKSIRSRYHAPYLAHATMEPMNATAHVTKDRCEIWAPTQAQSRAVQVAADITLRQPDEIVLHTTYLGGGFGRRAEVDYVAQAVHLSQELGVPVKVIWSREEDVQHDFYRPPAVAEFDVTLNDAGLPAAWKSKVVSDSIMAYFTKGQSGRIDDAMSEGIADQEYLIPNHELRVVSKDIGVPLGFWRSVGHSYTGFFLESMLDELAHAAGMDGLDYRRKLLKQDSRTLGVLEAVAAKAGWDKPVKPNSARGIAAVNSFGSYVAEVVEVSKSDKGIAIDKIFCAIDCGLVVNPSIVARQMQSAIIFGLSAALFGKINIKNGAVAESNFNDYPMLTLAQTPPIEVVIVESAQPPGGYGEPGLPPLAPALTNAIFALSGKRIRELPIESDVLDV